MDQTTFSTFSQITDTFDIERYIGHGNNGLVFEATYKDAVKKASHPRVVLKVMQGKTPARKDTAGRLDWAIQEAYVGWKARMCLPQSFIGTIELFYCDFTFKSANDNVFSDYGPETESAIFKTLSNVQSDGTFVMLVQPFASGTSASDWLYAKQNFAKTSFSPLTNEEIKSFLFQLIFPLAYAQSQIGFQHNDLKLENIVIDVKKKSEPRTYYLEKNGDAFTFNDAGLQVFIIDFGLSSIRTDAKKTEAEFNTSGNTAEFVPFELMLVKQTYQHLSYFLSTRHSDADMAAIFKIALNLTCHGRNGWGYYKSVEKDPGTFDYSSFKTYSYALESKVITADETFKAEFNNNIDNGNKIVDYSDNLKSDGSGVSEKKNGNIGFKQLSMILSNWMLLKELFKSSIEIPKGETFEYLTEEVRTDVIQKLENLKNSTFTSTKYAKLTSTITEVFSNGNAELGALALHFIQMLGSPFQSQRKTFGMSAEYPFGLANALYHPFLAYGTWTRPAVAPKTGDSGVVVVLPGYLGAPLEYSTEPGTKDGLLSADERRAALVADIEAAKKKFDAVTSGAVVPAATDEGAKAAADAARLEAERKVNEKAAALKKKQDEDAVEAERLEAERETAEQARKKAEADAKKKQDEEAEATVVEQERLQRETEAAKRKAEAKEQESLRLESEREAAERVRVQREKEEAEAAAAERARQAATAPTVSVTQPKPVAATGLFGKQYAPLGKFGTTKVWEIIAGQLNTNWLKDEYEKRKSDKALITQLAQIMIRVPKKSRVPLIQQLNDVQLQDIILQLEGNRLTPSVNSTYAGIIPIARFILEEQFISWIADNGQWNGDTMYTVMKVFTENGVVLNELTPAPKSTPSTTPTPVPESAPSTTVPASPKLPAAILRPSTDMNTVIAQFEPVAKQFAQSVINMLLSTTGKGASAKLKKSTTKTVMEGLSKSMEKLSYMYISQIPIDIIRKCEQIFGESAVLSNNAYQQLGNAIKIPRNVLGITRKKDGKDVIEYLHAIQKGKFPENREVAYLIDSNNAANYLYFPDLASKLLKYSYFIAKVLKLLRNDLTEFKNVEDADVSIDILLDNCDTLTETTKLDAAEGIVEAFVFYLNLTLPTATVSSQILESYCNSDINIETFNREIIPFIANLLSNDDSYLKIAHFDTLHLNPAISAATTDISQKNEHTTYVGDTVDSQIHYLKAAIECVHAMEDYQNSSVYMDRCEKFYNKHRYPQYYQ